MTSERTMANETRNTTCGSETICGWLNAGESEIRAPETVTPPGQLWIAQAD